MQRERKLLDLLKTSGKFVKEGCGWGRAVNQRQSWAGDKEITAGSWLRQIHPGWMTVPGNKGQFPHVSSGVASFSQEFYGLLRIGKGPLRSPCL